MMLFEIRKGVHYCVLTGALILLARDLNCGGAQAWTYNYSRGPNQQWNEARQWCQEHFIDMVAIRSQEEADFLNSLLPFNPKYYWIGVSKVNEEWKWAENNQKLPEEIQNWASEEPDEIAGQDCVEIYIKRRKDTAKWNNENCQKQKGIVCYSASCTKESCSAHADCVETVGSSSCKCYPGFFGPRCTEVTTCEPLTDPEQGFHKCFNPFGLNGFNSSCSFRCELGFRLVGEHRLICQANGHWSHPVPVCRAEQCSALNHTDFIGGTMNCSHPFSPHSYNSTCEFSCDEGYELIGQEHIQCDHNGQWTASIPACTVKKCSAIVSPLAGNMTCVDPVEPLSFSSQCTFTCLEGYYLTGDITLTCLASGQWSEPIPTCTAKRCESMTSPPHGSLSCSDPNGPFSFGSRCSTTCDVGFLLNGTASAECTSLGMWSAVIPQCIPQRCSPLNPPPLGSMLCSHAHGEFSFGSRCETTCEEGFLLNGTSGTECTSAGTWKDDVPLCIAMRCPTLESPLHGVLNCSDPHGEFSFGSNCTISCEEGFVLDGTAEIQCTSGSTWSTNIPQCLAKKCPSLKPPFHGSLECSDPHGEFSFGSQCTSTCQEGFVMNGTAQTQCTSLSSWSADVPFCQAKRCPTLKSPRHGSSFCYDPHRSFSFGSSCYSVCDEGFDLIGAKDTKCTSAGTWSREMPHCQARQCPLLDTAPQHGRLKCSHPNSAFSYGSHCKLECSEGFRFRGNSTVTCNSSGLWSQELPSCQLVQCEVIGALSLPLSMNCSHPLANFSFGSDCVFTCEDGFSLNGTAALLCNSTGFWSSHVPSCIGMSVGAKILLYTGYGAVPAAAVLLLVGLALLITMKLKKTGNMPLSDDPVWEERENPAFEF